MHSVIKCNKRFISNEGCSFLKNVYTVNPEKLSKIKGRTANLKAADWF